MPRGSMRKNATDTQDGAPKRFIRTHAKQDGFLCGQRRHIGVTYFEVDDEAKQPKENYINHPVINSAQADDMLRHGKKGLGIYAEWSDGEQKPTDPAAPVSPEPEPEPEAEADNTNEEGEA